MSGLRFACLCLALIETLGTEETEREETERQLRETRHRAKRQGRQAQTDTGGCGDRQIEKEISWKRGSEGPIGLGSVFA